MTRKATWRSISAAALIAAGVVSLAPGGTASAEETLTLRVNDARAEPGDLVAVVVRTYATRGMAQGEICLMASSGPDSAAIGAPALKGLRSKTMPFVALEAVEVASVAGDVTSLAAFDEPSQMALVRFSSPSGTVNESDGPLATFYFRVSENFAGPAEFLIAIDLGGTFLVDADGEPVTLEPLAGEFEIRAPGEALRLHAVGDRVPPGEVASLAVETEKPLAVAGGRLVLAYDSRFAGGSPELVSGFDGAELSYVLDTSEPGRLSLTFDSPDTALNHDPGRLLSFHLPTSSDLSDGEKSDLVIDAGSSYLVDSEGRWIGLELVDGEIEIDD